MFVSCFPFPVDRNKLCINHERTNIYKVFVLFFMPISHVFFYEATANWGKFLQLMHKITSFGKHCCYKETHFIFDISKHIWYNSQALEKGEIYALHSAQKLAI